MWKTGLGLVIAGFLLGDGLGLVGLAFVMFRRRKKDRLFWFLALLFAGFAGFLLCWIAAVSTIPREIQPKQYRLGLLCAFIILALGVWPATLHIIFGFWRKAPGPDALSGDQPVDFWLTSFAEIVQRELKAFFRNGNGRHKDP